MIRERFQLPVVIDGSLVIRDAMQSKVGDSGEALPVDPLPDRGKPRPFLAAN